MIYKLRTLDVWDTLLRRRCHPECIKVVVAHHVFLRHADRLARQYRDHWAVYHARLETEQTLAHESIAAGGDGEYTVHDVVRRWLEKIAPGHSLANSVQGIVEFEFHTEVACTTVDEDIHAVLAAHPAERTIFVSDFYWPSEMLVRLLQAKGLHDIVDAGVSSCDVGLNKRSGRLFPYVLERYGVEAADVVHVGDNPYSDVASPEAHGIHAVHFQPTTAHNNRLRREELFVRREQLFAEAAERTRLACDEHLGDRTDGPAAAFRAGAHMAPLFVGFSLFIAEQALHAGSDRIFFLMREGAFLRRVFDTVHAEGRFRGHALPESTLLWVSRASTFPAAVCDPVAEIVDGGRWPYRGHSLMAMVEALGIDASEIQESLVESTLRLDDTIEDVTSDGRVRTFLDHPHVRQAARNAFDSRRHHLTRYLHAMGFTPGGRYAVVDVGWRGTIQSNLARLGIAARLDGYYLALQRPLTPAPASCEAAAYLVDEKLTTKQADLFETYGVVEMLCTADTGTTVDYRSEGDVVRPVHSPSNTECPGFDAVIRPYQDGVALGCKIWAAMIEHYGYGAHDLAPAALAAWKALAHSPAQVIVQAFGETTLDDPFSRQRFIKPKDVPGIAAMLSACWDRQAWGDLRDYLRRIRWRQALQQPRSRATVGHRMVIALLVLGSWYRQLKCRLRRRTSAASTSKDVDGA